MNVQSSAGLVRRTLFFTLGLSVLANVGHTLLADSTVPVWLRMIGAIAWPVLVFLGVDITVKTAWDAITGKRGGIWLARLLILVPGVPAGITSYEHMHAVLLAMGERPFIALIGPGAVDLMMIGCTITLVMLQRVKPVEVPEAATPAAEITETSIEDFEIKPWTPEHGEQLARKVRQSSRAARNPGEQEQAIRMMLDGESAKAVENDLMGASTMRRYVRAERILRGDLAADPGDKLRPELVEIIRQHITAEQVAA
jgi:hypothetical protein